jgi:16S rRNA C967 or C1407 C5-methylase (RsmB/RsmF family)
MLTALPWLGLPACRVFAFDRDPKRLGVLKSRVVGQMGGSNVVPLLQDFLAVDVQEDTYSKVRDYW